MSKQLLALLQFGDSNFPSGAFSHSFGLETYIQEEKITDKASFGEAIQIYVEKQMVYTDGLACRLAFEALERGEMEDFFELDDILFASTLAKETRVGNQRIGERMAKLCWELYPDAPLTAYLERIKAKQSRGHAALVFAAVAHHLKVDLETTITTYLFSTVNSLVQNAVRGIPLGQTNGQKLLIELQPVFVKAAESIQQLSLDDLGAVSPGLEVAQMQHERLHVRIFMS